MRACVARLSVLVGLALALSVAPALAQAPTATQQAAQKLDAAVAAYNSSSSAATITITPPSGLSVYVDAISIENCAGASAVTAAAPTQVTTTNLTGLGSGSGPKFLVGSGVAAGLCQAPSVFSYAGGLKSTTPGTAVTVVLPTFATNQTINVNVLAHFAQ